MSQVPLVFPLPIYPLPSFLLYPHTSQDKQTDEDNERPPQASSQQEETFGLLKMTRLPITAQTLIPEIKDPSIVPTKPPQMPNISLCKSSMANDVMKSRFSREPSLSPDRLKQQSPKSRQPVSQPNDEWMRAVERDVDVDQALLELNNQ